MDQIEQLLRYALRIKDETLLAQIKKEASIRHIARESLGSSWRCIAGCNFSDQWNVPFLLFG